ncbi:tRNA pseudouridine(38/39) synthase isoform X2 [Iris pallida]|uniref:tRNA pseudouridine(38/39) synthase isoform X2 n=1 Tax=Iris pallida TaxID=29817 RepID=A0AAX6H4S6_IRIPA|nr:tRNA pseudouridine(38/39) synthase isoform X2 [Iris pallida]
MAATNGEDIPSGLHSQLTSLRHRVEELERENQRLQLLVSKCRCFQKAEDAKQRHNAAASLNEICKIAQQQDATIPAEVAKNFSSNNSSASFMNVVSLEEFNGLCADKSARCSKHGLAEQPGSQLSIVQDCAKRYVALKVMYFGQRFYGFASEAQMEPTVESEVFKALARTKLLVGDRIKSHYSRCGRTDRGVSSTGQYLLQVISLYLRSNLNDSGGTIRKEEIDYVRVLNRVLPKDIRVIGWSPVSTDFSARFSCLSREYRYLFWKGTLDTSAMQNAAEKFIGVHDYRNFCKMDAVNVKNYKRQITNFTISSCYQRSDADELWAMTIRGSAFLWHQVRCMVAVLFMIGQGLESPNVLDELLDIKKTPRKPQYIMAPELPLILCFCEFEDVNFICSSDSRRALHEHLTLSSKITCCKLLYIMKH